MEALLPDMFFCTLLIINLNKLKIILFAHNVAISSLFAENPHRCELRNLPPLKFLSELALVLLLVLIHLLLLLLLLKQSHKTSLACKCSARSPT